MASVIRVPKKTAPKAKLAGGLAHLPFQASQVSLAPGYTVMNGALNGPGVPAPAAPAPVAQPVAPAAGPVDPRDSIYGAGVSQLLGEVLRQRAAIKAAGETDAQNNVVSLGRLADSRSRDLDTTKTNANHEGLLYSGILGKRQGDVNTSYDQRQDDLNGGLRARNVARQGQLDATGEITANPDSPLGYTGTGNAGKSLLEMFEAAAGRRVATLPTDPVDVPAAPATAAPPTLAATAQPSVAPVTPTVRLNKPAAKKTTHTISRPVRKPKFG